MLPDMADDDHIIGCLVHAIREAAGEPDVRVFSVGVADREEAAMIVKRLHPELEASGFNVEGSVTLTRKTSPGFQIVRGEVQEHDA